MLIIFTIYLKYRNNFVKSLCSKSSFILTAIQADRRSIGWCVSVSTSSQPWLSWHHRRCRFPTKWSRCRLLARFHIKLFWSSRLTDSSAARTLTPHRKHWSLWDDLHLDTTSIGQQWRSTEEENIIELELICALLVCLKLSAVLSYANLGAPSTANSLFQVVSFKKR